MNPFTLISTKKVYENPWISVREDRVVRPGGKEGIFGVVDIAGWSHTVAIDKDNNIYLNREFCYGMNDYTYRLPWGGMSPWEAPLEAAKKELREEAGILADEWIDLWNMRPLTTVVDNIQYLFLAKNLTLTEQDTEEGEIVDIVSIPFLDAVKLVISGDIMDASTIIWILKAQKYLS